MQDAGLFIIWITFTVAALIGLCAVLVWAVRSRQFSNQDEARYLPLRSRIPEDAQAEACATKTTGGRASRSGSRKDEGTSHVSH